MTVSIPQALPAHLGWRLLALVYDLFPVLALVFAGSAAMLLLRGGIPVEPGSAGAYGEAVWLWTLCGAYFVISWQRGGQTLGMRPWRLRVVDAHGQRAGWPALATRYALATVPAIVGIELFALLPGIERLLPFWIGAAIAAAGPLWSLLDREGQSLYDRFAGTRFVRLATP